VVKRYCGTESWPATTGTIPTSEYMDLISSGGMKTGDLINGPSHVEVFISEEKGTGGAHGDSIGVSINGNGIISPTDGSIYRFKESKASEITDLNTEFSKTGSRNSGGGGEFQKIDYSKFYFNGTRDGKYSLTSREGFLKSIINVLKDIVDYLIGIETYLIRAVFVGWAAIFDNILNWSVTKILDTGADSDAESSVSGTEVKKTETDDREVNIETLIFNEFKILDINIFK